MNELQIFNNEEFGIIRTVEIDEKLIFCCKRCGESTRLRHAGKMQFQNMARGR